MRQTPTTPSTIAIGGDVCREAVLIPQFRLQQLPNLMQAHLLSAGRSDLDPAARRALVGPRPLRSVRKSLSASTPPFRPNERPHASFLQTHRSHHGLQSLTETMNLLHPQEHFTMSPLPGQTKLRTSPNPRLALLSRPTNLKPQQSRARLLSGLALCLAPPRSRILLANSPNSL